MSRPATITLSFLLVLLVIAGMTIKSQIENVARPVVDSLSTKPELISRLPYYAKAITDSTIHIVSVEGSGYTTASVGYYFELDTLNFFPNHSEIKP